MTTAFLVVPPAKGGRPTAVRAWPLGLGKDSQCEVSFSETWWFQDLKRTHTKGPDLGSLALCGFRTWRDTELAGEN